MSLAGCSHTVSMRRTVTVTHRWSQQVETDRGSGSTDNGVPAALSRRPAPPSLRVRTLLQLKQWR